MRFRVPPRAAATASEPAADRNSHAPANSRRPASISAREKSKPATLVGEWSFLSAAGSVASLPRAGRSPLPAASECRQVEPDQRARPASAPSARTSDTPGRDPGADLFPRRRPGSCSSSPGYGYAAAAKSKVSAWTRLIHDYLHGRLGRVYVPSTPATGSESVDDAIFDTLGKAAVSHQIVLTKCDQ